jgi:hypothetical protein
VVTGGTRLVGLIAMHGNELVRLGGHNNTIILGNGSEVVVLGRDTSHFGSFCDGNDSVSGGTNLASLTPGNGNVSVWDGGNNMNVLGYVYDVADQSSGTRHLVLRGSGNDTVSSESGLITLNLGSDKNRVQLSRYNNTVTVENGADRAKGADSVEVSSQDTTVSIATFNVISRAATDLSSALVFTSISDVVISLQSDGNGGTVIPLSQAAHIHFVVADSSHV